MVNKNLWEFPLSYSDPLPRIISGWGAYEVLGDECKAANIKKALIVTSGLKGTGLIDEVRSSLNYHGVATELYDKVNSNPRDWQVMEAYAVLKAGQCDGVVSVGGGSSHDAGKMVRAVAANDGQDVKNFAVYLNPPWMEQVKKLKPCNIPQVALNTTAGTGAEITSLATLTNTQLRAKQLVIAPKIGCVTAIVDPLLIRMMPKEMAAWTGFDALAHAFETFIGRVQSPYTAGLSLRAIKLVFENLRAFTYNRMNQKACENMSYAASIGGIIMGLGSGAGLVHGLGHQLSALTDIHHGLANANFTIPVSRYNQALCMDKFAEMAQAMGVDTRGLTTAQASDRWFDEMERLIKDLEIPTGHLHDNFGLKQEDIDHMIKIYSNDFPREGNPREYNYDEIYKIIEDLY